MTKRKNKMDDEQRKAMFAQMNLKTKKKAYANRRKIGQIDKREIKQNPKLGLAKANALVNEAPIESIEGIGPAQAKRLHEYGYYTVGDLEFDRGGEYKPESKTEGIDKPKMTPKERANRIRELNKQINALEEKMQQASGDEYQKLSIERAKLSSEVNTLERMIYDGDEKKKPSVQEFRKVLNRDEPEDIKIERAKARRWDKKSLRILERALEREKKVEPFILKSAGHKYAGSKAYAAIVDKNKKVIEWLDPISTDYDGSYTFKSFRLTPDLVGKQIMWGGTSTRKGQRYFGKIVEEDGKVIVK